MWTNRETGQRQEHTEWHQAVCFDRHAEIVGKYLTKGDEIFIEGRQRMTQWTDNDGKLQKGVQVRVDKFRMFARTPKEEIDRALRILDVAKDALHKIAGNQPEKLSLTDIADMLDLAQWEFKGRPEGE